MTEFSKARRQLMLGTAAWVGGIAGMAAAKPAGAAMQAVELKPTSPLGAAVANRCKLAADDHADIRAQLMAELAADPALKSLTERCPICGCPIIVSR
ncbi:MAG TPA: hypothetical protein VH020_12330 [Stellaceae bacterium]|jgi:hypothetical protein|nr:hypothetical protein [Stellaceae bacterium]